MSSLDPLADILRFPDEDFRLRTTSPELAGFRASACSPQGMGFRHGLAVALGAPEWRVRFPRRLEADSKTQPVVIVRDASLGSHQIIYRIRP